MQTEEYPKIGLGSRKELEKMLNQKQRNLKRYPIPGFLLPFPLYSST